MMMRIGHGYDVHACGQGSYIVLGGTRIECGFSLIAHSDGDVVLHALCDALLGAAGLGISVVTFLILMHNFKAWTVASCCEPL